MAKKRKKPAVKRQRRSAFATSLDYATKKLEKALARQSVIEAELAALKQEIPYLQTVIRALTPKPTVELSSVVRRYTPERIATIIVDPLPSNVRPFLEPLSANVDELPGEEDAFLNIKIPGEQELLP